MVGLCLHFQVLCQKIENVLCCKKFYMLNILHLKIFFVTVADEILADSGDALANSGL